MLLYAISQKVVLTIVLITTRNLKAPQVAKRLKLQPNQ